MIDVEHAVIIDVEATPARTYDEVAATRTMIDRTEKVFGAKPERLAADTAYGTGKMLAWLFGQKALYVIVEPDLEPSLHCGWAVLDSLLERSRGLCVRSGMRKKMNRHDLTMPL
jgi:hypothetical protein